MNALAFDDLESFTSIGVYDSRGAGTPRILQIPLAVAFFMVLCRGTGA